MGRLQQLFQRAGPEPLARQPQAGLDHRPASCNAGSSAACAASPRTPRSSRRRSRARTTTTTQFRDLAKQATHGRGRVLGARHAPTSTTRSRILRPVYDDSDGGDGFVSVEVAPELARDTDGTIAAARDLHEQIDEPNLFVKIPGTAEGVPAIRQMICRGPQHQRHAAVRPRALRRGHRGATCQASKSAWPRAATSPPSPASRRSSSAASTPKSTAASRRIGDNEALALRGKAAVANAQLAYELFLEKSAGRPLGRAWPRRARRCSDRCGRRRRRRTPPIPTRSTSTPSSDPTR